MRRSNSSPSHSRSSSSSWSQLEKTDAGLGEAGTTSAEEDVVGRADELAGPAPPTALELLGGGQTVGARAPDPGGDLVLADPATRTWKNSSRFWLKIARNLARSSSGVGGSSARRQDPAR